MWSPFSTPENGIPPLQSHCEGCLLWQTTMLTKTANHDVNWPAHPGFALLCSVFPLGYLFSTWLSNFFLSLQVRSGVYDKSKKNQKHILPGIKSSWAL